MLNLRVLRKSAEKLLFFLVVVEWMSNYLNACKDILCISGMVRKLVLIILISVAVVAGFMLWIVGVPVLGMQYTFWKIHKVLDSVPERELIARTADLPEVRAFLAKYENPRTYIDTDFHVAVVYAITECELTGQDCDNSRTNAAYLDVRLNLDTGFPEHSRFWCDGENYGRFPLGDETLVQHIQDC